MGNAERFATEKYRNLPLTDLAAYAIVVLEAKGLPRTIEHITVTLFELFPAKFAMVGYAQYPDGMRANRTLLQMMPKYRNYATGSATKGYALTSIGKAAAQRVGLMLGAESAAEESADAAAAGAERGKGRARTKHPEDIVVSVENSQLFGRYKDGRLSDARGVDFLAMIDAFSHTPKKVIRDKLKEIREAAKYVGNADVTSFIDSCEDRFESFIKE